MKKQLFILFALGLAVSASSQTAKQKRADRSYNDMAYASAAAGYASLEEQGMANVESLHRLAESYYLMGDLGSAESRYGQLNASGQLTTEELYHYAQCLRWNGKYEESDNIMAQFATANPNDLRSKDYLANKDAFAKIRNQEAKFSLRNLEINTREADFGTAYRGDQIVFASAGISGTSVKRIHTWNNSPFLNVFMGSVSAANGEIEKAKPFRKKINSRYHEGPACFSPDGSMMCFTRNNYFEGKFGKDSKGVNNLKIYVARLEGDQWSNESAFPFNDDQFSVGHPAFSPDGKWLYFVSDMPGGAGGCDIWKCMVSADGTFGKPENLGNAVNTEGNEMFPFVHADGSLFFASNGHVGFGGLDVFQSRPNSKGSFGSPINLGAPLNSSADDFAFVMDKNQKTGYVSSNRQGGKGSDDIYSVAVLSPLTPVYKLDGIARDKQSKEVLANSSITLLDASGNAVGTATTRNDGSYSFDVEPGMQYTLKGTHEGFYDEMEKISTTSLSPSNPTLKEDLDLNKDPGLQLVGLVLDKSNGKPVNGAKVTIVDKLTNQPFATLQSGTAGDLKKPVDGKKIGDPYNYKITVEKEGYLSETVEMKDVVKGSEISFRADLDKLEVGADLGKMIDINPIYFDLNKDNIRPDASVELDKIVAVMKEYPTMVIELGSHTDCRASKAYNEKLSDRRAKSSAAYIVSKGIDRSRIYGKGYGESELVNDCACEGNQKSDCSEEQHQLNRRTVFKIVKM